jgi:alcohol dehydrogenase (cytochrome c)
MRTGLWLAAVLAFAASSAALSQAPVPASSEGIYTAAQASQGASLYVQNCAACHGANLEGGAAPALKGESFAQMMAFQKLTPNTLMAITAQAMPLGAPASLSRENYLALTAYMLQQNGYRAGSAPFEAAAACADCNAPVRVSLAGAAPVPAGFNDHAAPSAPAAPAPAAPPGAETVLARPVPPARQIASTDAAFRAASGDQNNWLLHGRTYDNQRFSTLTQVTRANVKKLRPAAIIQTGVLATMEATPIVVDGVMYVSTSRNGVQAYDAVTGKPFWR